MNGLFTHASLKRSPRTRTRKNSISQTSEARCPPSRSSSTATRHKNRPLPLQIIPELSENEFDIDTSPTPSPATARPLLSIPSQPEPSKPSPRVTLSAYTFSIDDALLMFNGESPGSPALSASSSTSGSASSEEVPTTPGASDDEDACNLRLPGPRFTPKRVSIRPLCINKTRSFLCSDDEDIDDIFGDQAKEATEDPLVQPVAEEKDVEDEHDFYAREFQDFISLYSVRPPPSSPARRDSIVLSPESLPTIEETPEPQPEPKPRGRSRHSKALPSIPLPTPPLSSFPSVPTFPLVQTTAQSSVVRRKRNIPPLPKYPPPPPPAIESRPPPRMSVPDDVNEAELADEDFVVDPRPPIVIEQVWFDDEEDEESVYSQPSFAPALPPASTNSILSPAIPETPLDAMYAGTCVPRSSIDSDAPRSSIDSEDSYHSSAHSPISPFSFPSTPSTSEHDHDDDEPSPALRSRWSSSTLSSLVEQPRTTALLSPLKGVFGSRSWRAPAPSSPARAAPAPLSSRLHIRTPSKLPTHTRAFPTTPSPPSTPLKQVRRRGSRSSTSSAGTSHWGSSSVCSECESCESGANGRASGGLRRKPIPVEMFLRT
ncbi:hypothetical protein F5I97DRAFT_336935 [Phlebopus sp. FC_14]|nr:hypothetical protein F5I97DRAFT_336935 [Phlebopus sp. FC_14]